MLIRKYLIHKLSLEDKLHINQGQLDFPTHLLYLEGKVVIMHIKHQLETNIQQLVMVKC